MKNQQLKRTTLNGWGKVLTVALLFLSSPLMAQTTDQLPENNPPIQNPKSKIQNPLPCMDSSPECVQQLTEAAVSNSPQLKLLGEKITIIEQQLELLGKRIEYSRKRSWTSYITIDPVKLIQNIFGGGDVQRDKLAIADLQVKTAQLESALAEMERRKEEEKINLGDKVLRLVLDYEAVSRKYALVESQLITYSQQQEILRIRYRLGQGETAEFLESQVKGEGLRGQLVELESLLSEKVRELGQVTGL
jgi:outer membrane protein TolC